MQGQCVPSQVSEVSTYLGAAEPTEACVPQSLCFAAGEISPWSKKDPAHPKIKNFLKRKQNFAIHSRNSSTCPALTHCPHFL